jgi:TRAP-type C4-dicarboxylate transport system permease small subunit
MEFVLDRLPKRGRNIFNTVTRVACAILFVVIAINLFRVAAGFSSSGEVSPTLKLPIYPFAYGLGICCIVQCLVFLCDIIRIWEGRYE